METNNKLAKEKEVEEDRETNEDLGNVCKHCNTDPCWSRELEPMFQSLMEIFTEVDYLTVKCASRCTQSQ